MMTDQPGLPPERKALYYTGGILMLLGLALFLSNFFLIASVAGRPFGSPNPMSGFAARGVGGMLLMGLGAFVRQVGARGTAGSGLLLDPEQARADLKPWAQTAGGLLKDALGEVRGEGEAGAGAAPESQAVQPQIKVRCTRCRTLNDEDARFCKGCGAAM